MRTVILLGVIACLLYGCKTNYPALQTVNNVDIDRYLGKWYEIAAIPQSFEKGCHCSVAEYTKTNDDYIQVVNSCRKDSLTGEIDKANGKAFIVPNSNNAKLKVQFFWPFRGDYWIIDLAEDYSYAVVGNPTRKYLWILSRKPTMDDVLYNQIIDRVSSKGYDISLIRKMPQGCL